MGYSELKAVSDLWLTKKDVAGALANWAVKQSPYAVPDNLADVLTKFQEIWRGDENGMHKWPSMEALEHSLDHVFTMIPELEAWNNRKNGREGMGFSSRYDQPSPDDDFIDLGALSRNVAMMVWKDAVEFKAFNDRFDAEWAGREGAAREGAASADTQPEAGDCLQAPLVSGAVHAVETPND